MRRIVSVASAAALAALGLGLTPAEAAPGHPDAEVAGVAAAFGLTADQARAQLAAQDDAHRLAAALPASVRARSAGQWFDAAAGKLTVAVTSAEAAEQARAAGAAAKVVARSQADLDRTDAAVRTLVGAGVPGVYGWGVDVRANEVGVDVDRTKTTAATESFLSRVREIGVRITETSSSPRQQSGTIQTGNPWWPGSESNCSVGFPVTDPAGAKHFLTAGHCTNDRDQAAYGASGQQNKIGTSNVGGTHSVNGREGDMGVVAVTEAGWNLSASVNTWGQPAVTLSGAAEAMVGDRVCHSGNTSHWQCGEVKYTHKSVDYGGGLVIDDLTWTTACSLGGDSGGGWLLGDKATGLHDGGPSQCVDNPSDGDLSLFQPVAEALSKWGLTLVTGGGTGDTTAPSTPGNPRATGATSSSVSLAWDASTDDVGVTGYDVYNGSALATSVAGTSATVTGLAPDTAYTFTVKAHDAAGNASVASEAVAARTQAGGGGRTLTNDTDYAIRDYQQVFSPITSTLTGSAAATIGVSLTIRHTCAEDLGITLLDPRGRAYALKYSGGSTCTPWSGAHTFTVPGVAAPASGKWQLRVTDYGPGDTGTLDTWSVTL
ncbi:proprotein convertase P-domain-containing protein [Amycolatopsis sp. OK19-0408]|uniref:Proprotein convertase P-domain-containing protein n=1 Tax=Amycolatopsis iheyensis TaxID=2945988 RepID=A0A9X2NC09_9PSEU|nr:proprotein convertase P-domain-containing protein [Amycolatopsis iheyensis]MCR6484533.1 proprotein convertase P-domain-containing protein [Amycolatopsis iheyensis]